MTLTGNRFISSIGISPFKVKDCFQDNCCKITTFFNIYKTFYQLFCNNLIVCPHNFHFSHKITGNDVQTIDSYSVLGLEELL
jgi:hypothetical protein